MHQTEIDNLVAEATGETVSEVRRLGFSLADPLDVKFDPEPSSYRASRVDWLHRVAIDSARY